MKTYTVYLYRAPDCKRGWLAYIEPTYSNRATFIVSLKAENGPKAKNAAITAANNNFKGVEIIDWNNTDMIWGLNMFPELQRFKKEE